MSPTTCGRTKDKLHISYLGISVFLSIRGLELAPESLALSSEDLTHNFLWGNVAKSHAVP